MFGLLHGYAVFLVEKGTYRGKAISVRGIQGLPVYDIDKAYAKGVEAFQKVAEKQGFTEWTPEGTASLTNWCNEVGAFPTRNFQTSFSQHYEAIN